MKKKVLTVIVFALLLAGTAQSTTINENSGTQASADITVDRPWYTSVTVLLDENLPDFLKFIKDFWSWMVDSLFINDNEQDKQVVR